MEQESDRTYSTEQITVHGIKPGVNKLPYASNVERGMFDEKIVAAAAFWTDLLNNPDFDSCWYEDDRLKTRNIVTYSAWDRACWHLTRLSHASKDQGGMDMDYSYAAEGDDQCSDEVRSFDSLLRILIRPAAMGRSMKVTVRYRR